MTRAEKLKKLYKLVSSMKTALLSEDIERGHIAGWTDEALKIISDLSIGKKGDKIIEGLITALEGILEIENQQPKKYIIDMKKRIITDIRYLEGGSQKGNRL